MVASKTQHAVENIRNIAFVGHARAGKTTLIEQLLTKSGATNAAGSIEKGNTTSDFTEQERRLQHSLDVAVCHLEHDDTFVNLLDTPGYPDFVGRTLAVLPAAETVAVVINAQRGVEFVAQRIMENAAKHKHCRLVIVNQIDAPGVNLAEVLNKIRTVFGDECLPLNLPAERGQSVADCFFEPADVDPDFSSVEAAHTEILDQVVELDDELMELYLEQGEELSLEQLHNPFERALRRGHLIPVCFTSAETGAGLRQLLRIFTQLMPNPFEGNPVEIFSGPEGERRFRLDPKERNDHFVGHVFKLNVDPYVGRLATLRVLQGELRNGDHVYVGERRKAAKIAHIYRVQGKNTQEVSRAVAGDFCALAKIDGIAFNDVLHSSHDEDGLRMPAPDVPEPMYGLALELNRRGQEKKLSDGLHKFAAEDPSLRIDFNSQLNETVLRGVGDLHLRLVIERLRDEFGVDVTTHPPKVAYRETVSRTAEGHCRHKKQTGGAGQFGEVFLKVEPLARGTGFEFVNRTVGGSIPGQYIPAVEKGVRQVLTEGAVTGNPMQDLRVIVYDGKHHPVDSKEVAFVAAGRKAFLDAVTKANPIVLEPIASIEISTPNQHVGDVSGYLAGIRGRVSGTEVLQDNRTKIAAQVPVAELDDFQTTLKSLTAGEGLFVLQLDHYESAPANVQKTLTEEYRPKPDT